VEKGSEPIQRISVKGEGTRRYGTYRAALEWQNGYLLIAASIYEVEKFI